MKKLIVKRPVGGRGRGSSKYETDNTQEAYVVEVNQFFATYSDGTREVRDIRIDYNDYKSDTYENIKYNISQNIARLRKEKSLSYEDVAVEAGVSRQYIAQIENCERNVSLEILSKIAESLDVNVEFLIKKNPFSPGNIYIDKLVCEIRELDIASRKELCAKIIEDLWKENS